MFKFLFYAIALIFLYRSLFGQKIIVEHRYKSDFWSRKPKPNNDKPQRKDGEYTDYEEIK